MDAITCDEIYRILNEMKDIDSDLPEDESERDLNNPEHKELILKYQSLEGQLKEYCPLSTRDLIDYHNHSQSGLYTWEDVEEQMVKSRGEVHAIYRPLLDLAEHIRDSLGE